VFAFATPIVGNAQKFLDYNVITNPAAQTTKDNFLACNRGQ
jgi:hypothetical protein